MKYKELSYRINTLPNRKFSSCFDYNFLNNINLVIIIVFFISGIILFIIFYIIVTF